MQNLLANFQRDMPREKIREMLGIPVARSNISFMDGKRKRAYILEQYDGEFADVFLIGNEPFNGIAVAIKDGKIPKGKVPIPNYVIQDGNDIVGLGDFPLDDLKDSCSGKFSNGDARYLYVTTPPCYFGKGGGYSYFVFGFDGGLVIEPCKIDIFELSAEKLEDIRCKAFWAVRPNFVLTYLPQEHESEQERHAYNMASAVLEAIYWKQ
jgi:hypothetical protein